MKKVFKVVGLTILIGVAVRVVVDLAASVYIITQLGQ